MSARISQVGAATPKGTTDRGDAEGGTSPPSTESIELLLSQINTEGVRFSASKFIEKKSSRDISVQMGKGFQRTLSVELEDHQVFKIDSDNVIANTGADDCVNCVCFNGETVAMLVDNSVVQFWTVDSELNSINFVGDMDLGPDVVRIKWVKWALSPGRIMGLLAVVTLTNVQLHVIPSLSPSMLLTIDPTSSLLWTCSASFFPNNLDARISKDRIEIITSNNANNFIHLFLLRVDQGGTKLARVKVFATSDNSSDASTCCAFVGNSNFFFAGLSNGSIFLWDIRDDHGPKDTIITLAGIRRWLVDLKSTDSLATCSVLAAFQAGAIVNMESEIQVQPIGGDVKTSQCLGIDCVGSRVFVAMSSGVVLTMDRSLRDKLRRGMTGYVSQWECESVENDLSSSSSASLMSKLMQNRRKDIKKIYLNIYEKKEFPKNLKNLKASDGANNDPSPLRPNDSRTSPLSIKCLCAADQIVGYGLEGGLVHFFNYRD